MISVAGRDDLWLLDIVYESMESCRSDLGAANDEAKLDNVFDEVKVPCDDVPGMDDPACSWRRMRTGSKISAPLILDY